MNRLEGTGVLNQMSQSQFDVVGFLTDLQRRPDRNRLLPFLGWDENLNHQKVQNLVNALSGQEKIGIGSPLWYKTRVDQLDGKILFSILGGVDRDTVIPPSVSPTLGADQRGQKWDDQSVVTHLVGYFLHYDHLVLLSADTHRDKDGLWMVLNTEAKSNLPEGSSLTVLFKETGDLDVYCRKVEEFFALQTRFKPGYFEDYL